MPRRSWPRRSAGAGDQPGLEHPLAPRPHRRQPRHQGGDRRAISGPAARRIPGRDIALSEGERSPHRRARRAGGRGARPHARPCRAVFSTRTAWRSSATPCSRWAAAGCSKARRNRCTARSAGLPLCPATRSSIARTNIRSPTPASPPTPSPAMRPSPTVCREVEALRDAGEITLPTTRRAGTRNQSLRSSLELAGIRAPADGERQLPLRLAGAEVRAHVRPERRLR